MKSPAACKIITDSLNFCIQNKYLGIASAVTVICIFIGSLAAYALTRIPFRFNRSIQLGIIATRMIPEVSLVLPLFIIASSLQLINRPLVLIITYMSFALPYAIWLMAAYFQTVPLELEDAAWMVARGWEFCFVWSCRFLCLDWFPQLCLSFCLPGMNFSMP